MANSSVIMNLQTGALSGDAVVEVARNISDLCGVFADEAAQARLAPDTLVYRVQCYLPVPAGTPGGLYWGTTVIQPGFVGDEYFMTKGHFHSLPDRAEYYITACGEGALILMDMERRTRFEPMRPGSVHYIPGHTAHRVANTGAAPLSFFACWPSDAGHDYATIARDGFSARLRYVAGRPVLIPVCDGDA
jgi:glucose-6-phosphate isomerase